MDDKSLNPKASQETFISLLQLDPVPIEPSPDGEKELPSLPEEGGEAAAAPKSAGTFAGLGLSGRGYGAAYYCLPSSPEPSRRPIFFTGSANEVVPPSQCPVSSATPPSP